MASSKNKGFLWKKPNSELRMIVSSLKKENAYLKKTLVELSRQHSEHNKLVERFLSLETVRLESSQQLTGEDEQIASPPEQLSKKEGKLSDVVSMRRKRSMSSYCREMEEVKNKLVSVSTRCQYLENKVAGKKDSTSDELSSTDNVVELQNHLCDALEKNKQWLEYDQQREAYVRAILARMLWLETQLNEANQARSQQHNEDHSDVKEQISQMQEHYEGFLQKAKDELEVLREHVDMTQQNLIIAQNRWEDKESEVEELKLQLQAERMSRKSAQEERCSEDDEQRHRYETEELLHKLDEEKRRSANVELQANICQKFMLNNHHADQEKIADLERQIKISSQDLEDERQDCSYLKEQMVRVLKMLQKTKRHVIKKSKRDQQSHSSFEMAHPPSLPSGQIRISSPHSSLLNESFLECPSCQAEYPVSHYRELLNHLEICVD
ncbi:centrosomal protein of 55 kDa-like isoform X1 [Morone saxatilis]|uniref:centrosomal protein of 55 kDa-like isoform X1 n=1 Tax=Morone saxatilis TaxID=34816 RepID=UPI0015E1EAFE|nr:centrosomal protein of 55 kDa-like isoform X1 [Morone saxatilis]XP_035519290.1 centrosomal protein of 55 kDa-like isoform X1 [Morone saxatilis]